MSEIIRIPHTYRILGSGDCIPVFRREEKPIQLELHDDGSVTWAREENS